MRQKQQILAPYKNFDGNHLTCPVSIFFLKIGVDGKYNDWTVFREATYIFFPPVGKECGYTYCVISEESNRLWPAQPGFCT